MSAHTPSVSVIIVTFNAAHYIERCLASVFAQSHGQFEVIVVDNASTDASADLVRQRFPLARLIASPTNEGYGGGNNRGAGEASGEILVFLNPDAVPEREWLTQLTGSMREQFRQYATSKITMLSDSNKLNSSGNLIHYLGLSFCRGLNAERSSFATAELVAGASGAACAISRDLFERLGGFDRTLFMYHDDVDLSLRALLAGERCLYVPAAVVAHDYSLVLPPVKWGWIEAHRYAVLFKTFKLRTLLILSPALLLIDLVTLVYLTTRGPAFLLAKLRSYMWLLRHARSILHSRRRAQALRAVTDWHIVSVLTDQIPYEQLAPGWVAEIAHILVDPWFRMYRQLGLAVIRW
jgi:GT2 family glycosyltransferase